MDLHRTAPDPALVEDVARALRLFVEPGQVTELRALRVQAAGYRQPVTIAGYYDSEHLSEAAAEAVRLEKISKGIYFVPNPLDPPTLLRRPNRTDRSGEGELAHDGDVIHRRWLLIDADPKRPAGTNATDEEKARSRVIIAGIRHYLEGLGATADNFVTADSGNGYHLLLRIDLPAGDPDELARGFLWHLADRFDSPAVEVDRKVFNAARIIKLYGTLTRKGDATDDRPHRRSGVIESPAESAPFNMEVFVELAREGNRLRQDLEESRRAQAAAAAASPTIPIYDRQDVIKRAVADSLTWDQAIQGQNGSGVTIRVASRLVNGWGLSYEEAWPILKHYSETRCVPPWSDRELAHKLKDAIRNGDPNRRPKGYLVADRPRADAVPSPAATPAGSRNVRHGLAATPAVAEPAEAAEPAEMEPIEPDSGLGPDRPNMSKVLAGVAGDLVRALEADTEADPLAILVQFMVMFGNILGRTVYFPVEASRHYPNLFAVMVGRTSKGRKGTSKERALQVFGQVGDHTWLTEKITSGLSSGEGLIEAVCDRKVKLRRKRDEQGREYVEEVEEHPGVADKRLMVVESEFVAPLRIMRRDGNTLSAKAREAWDSGNLSSITKLNPSKATGAHISIIGHISKTELLRSLEATEAANGFANRFLWVHVSRSKMLPEGGRPVDLTGLATEVASAINAIRGWGPGVIMSRSPEATELWDCLYRGPLAAEHPGMAGAILARAEAHVLRLSMLYALMEGVPVIEKRHLESAYELWRYCERTALWVWGETLGDGLADVILATLRDAGPEGLRLSQLHGELGRNHEAAKVRQCLRALQTEGLVCGEKEKRKEGQKGRVGERWRYVGDVKKKAEGEGKPEGEAVAHGQTA